ncbi:MAG: GAF domain-containing protein [Desulfobulbaceae bacterium]|uniref:GAF domain-containing protein n=1 Tax=Candidatus Desulfobia pelagia TaxID=2841692 RepID=A0A8J6NBX2_9BACT|nr:GAF domain-containing protein [Candidatus Desulfobia pelagia]
MDSDLTQKNEDVIQLQQERDVFKKQFLKMRSNYENKIKELSILKELGNTLRTTHGYDKAELLESQLKMVEKYSSLSFIQLFLLDEKKDSLYPIARSGAESLEIEQLFLEKKNNPAWQALREGRHIIAKDNDIIYPAAMLNPPRNGACLLLPLLEQSRAIGVCVLHHKNEDAFDPNQIRFLSLVSDHMVTTIAISRFYQKMREEENQRSLLSRFFSKTVIDKILSSKENLRLGGERRDITVLFADLSGFTAMSENLDQETVVEILNGYFSRITPIIFNHHGTLDKFMGDGLLAFFGAPISVDNAPGEAVQTAIEIIREIDLINRQNTKKNWPTLHASIGINAGEVVAGYIGSEEHLNYTVIGDAVNVAQRIETIAGPDTILISEAVRNRILDKTDSINGFDAMVALSPLKLKGKEDLIQLYRIETAL